MTAQQAAAADVVPYDSDLDTAQMTLKVVRALLEKPSLAALVQAFRRLDETDEDLNGPHRCALTAEDLAGPARQTLDEAFELFRRQCRTSQTRAQLCKALAPSPGPPAQGIVWMFLGSPLTHLGELLLSAFASAEDRSHLNPSWHVLYVPTWMPGKAVSAGQVSLVGDSTTRLEAPCTPSQAETAALLWRPLDPGSPFHYPRAALSAARALLA